MFQQLRNIDSAFKFIRLFSCLFLLACVAVSGLSVYKSYEQLKAGQQRIYILVNGKVLEAFASERKHHIPVEARQHVKMFHHYFFSLDPDPKVIEANISKALYLADFSAKRQYDNLKESGYYSNIISANISQTIQIDKVEIDINQYPFHFKCSGKQQLIRSTSIVTRSLITEGYLRNLTTRSDNNPNGFLIENWKILENKDQKIIRR